MCSFFSERMDSDDKGGDLGDIIRSSSCSGTRHLDTISDWTMPLEPLNFTPAEESTTDHNFRDPITALRDPLFNELAGATMSKTTVSSTSSIKLGFQSDESFHGLSSGMAGSCIGGSTLVAARRILMEEMAKPGSIFSTTDADNPQPSTEFAAASPSGIRPHPPPISVGVVMTMNNAGLQACRPPDHVGMQISSPRTPGVKRRKSQAKKVVCIPAPAAAGSRTSGEVVPSDLWAWRKYGQKPIKGSPYPRGYYRCSSSKGCSARKQVERSRTDPNMLVITYTSEHNHPWPTQRNALAGSTRPHPLKTNNTTAPKSLLTQKENESHPIHMSEIVHEQYTMNMNINDTTTTCDAPLKEECVDIAMDVVHDRRGLDQIFPHSYESMVLTESGQQSSYDHFFADLVELDAGVPEEMGISKEFMDDGPIVNNGDESGGKQLDPFSIFDWVGNSFEEPNTRGL